MSENQTVTAENQTAGDEKPTIVAVFTSPDGDTVRAELHGEDAASLMQRIDICLRTCAGVATEELESLPVGLNVLLPSMDGLASVVKRLHEAANDPDSKKWMDAKSVLTASVADLRNAVATH